MAFMNITIDNKGKEFPKDGTIEDDITAKNSGASFSVKPPEGSYLAYSRVKVPFRKITGSPEKIIDYIKKYFITFKKALQDNRDNIDPRDIKLVGDKF
jgi:hypothetical protein